MLLGQYLEAHIAAFIDGQSSLDALHDWLVDHVQDIADLADPATSRLADRAWILIAELDQSHRSEQSVREEFSKLLPLSMSQAGFP